MLLVPLFLCIGFMIAILYIDLMFDVMAVPYRRASTPPEVVGSIVTYYGRITQNPYLLMFVMFTAMVCIVAELWYQLVPAWVGYSSLVFMGIGMGAGAGKVIPAAQRLSSGKEPEDARAQLIRSMFPWHVILLASILSLALVQGSTTLR